MKQALSPETPARVRRGQFRAITLGIGASALAMACSFGEIDDTQPIDDIQAPAAADGTDATQPGTVGDGTGAVTPGTSPSAADPAAPAFDPDGDPFSTEEGQQVRSILETNCGTCHSNGVKSGDMDFILDLDQLIATKKVIPGDKDGSIIYVRMLQKSMPPNYIKQRPTDGQIELVGKFFNELPVIEAPCEKLPFLSNDEMISAMAADVAKIDDADKPFIRYLNVAYSTNAGECGRNLERQQFALYKGINSVSTNAVVTQPQAIDENKLIFRIDIRDYNWDRDIDLEDDGIVDFADGWDAIVDKAGPFAVEFAGDQADDLKADTQTAVPFMAVNAFIQVTETDDLYYALIGAKANLFDFEKEVLGIDTVVEIADDNLMRAGFANSGVSEQERVLNRFDSKLGNGYAYWISFDFDGGNGNGGVGGVSNGFEANVANESIYEQPLDFAFAGGEAIFNLPNGMQAYYVAAANGNRLGEAPVGVVIDPAQNNGVVVNGASCHTCHNAGMITFTDTVKQYVLENKTKYDSDTFQAVMAVYPDQKAFQAQMDKDSQLHITRTERAGIPAGSADGISRVFLEFQLGDVTLERAAAELGVTAAELEENISLLDPRFGNLKQEGGYLSRDLFTDLYADALCILNNSSENAPAVCP